jgi:hypothetical protein
MRESFNSGFQVRRAFLLQSVFIQTSCKRLPALYPRAQPENHKEQMRKILSLVLSTICLIGFTACSDAAINSVEILAQTSAKANSRVSITGRANPTPGLSKQNTTVTWSIQSGSGSLSDVTTQSVVFSTPNVSTATLVIIRATAASDPNKFQDATITITP